MKVLLIGLVLASGCVAEGKDPGGTTTDPGTDPQPRTARQMFEQDVFPILNTNCGGCHTSATPASLNFLTTDAATTYPVLVADRDLVGDFSPATALILQMQNVNGHIALRYTDADKAK